jgi:adenylate cyclase class 2
LIEAELKARVADPESVRALLQAAAGEPERARYEDTYLDRGGELAADGRELRVRTVVTPTGDRSILTYKGPVLDAVSGSKTEAETVVQDPGAALAVLFGLGFATTIAFEKHCENYRLSTTSGRGVLATLVTVPELAGTFLEVETMAEDEADMRASLDELGTLLLDLEIGPDALTTELYTDAVAATRADRFIMKPGDIVWDPPTAT